MTVSLWPTKNTSSFRPSYCGILVSTLASAQPLEPFWHLTVLLRKITIICIRPDLLSKVFGLPNTSSHGLLHPFEDTHRHINVSLRSSRNAHHRPWLHKPLLPNASTDLPPHTSRDMISSFIVPPRHTHKSISPSRCGAHPGILAIATGFTRPLCLSAKMLQRYCKDVDKYVRAWSLKVFEYYACFRALLTPNIRCASTPRCCSDTTKMHTQLSTSGHSMRFYQQMFSKASHFTYAFFLSPDTKWLSPCIRSPRNMPMPSLIIIPCPPHLQENTEEWSLSHVLSPAPHDLIHLSSPFFVIIPFCSWWQLPQERNCSKLVW